MGKGSPPIARYQHSMDVYHPSRLLIVYGGKNDKRTNVPVRSLYYYNMGILDLVSLDWMTVQLNVSGSKPLISMGRCSHVTLIDKSKFMILGGYNYNGFLPNEIV